MEYYLASILLFLLVLFLLLSSFAKRLSRTKIQREEERLQRTFSNLVAEFNRISNININILEDKIQELKAVVREADQRARELREVLSSSPFSERDKYREVEHLISSGMKVEEAAKKVKMGKGEVQLIFDLSQRKKRKGIK